MASPTPIQATVLRQPSPNAVCDCEHSVDCVCGCHDRNCDPSQLRCDTDFLPDEGGLAYWGCPECTPGQSAPHYLGCELIGWNVPVGRQQAPSLGAASFA
ncbi:MAG: hypothetical protein ACC726_01335 [Chloroflexota bacterium]